VEHAGILQEDGEESRARRPCHQFMKIVHVITRLIVGGAQENTLISCEGQHRAGHDVTLIAGPAIGPEGSLLERAMAGGYRVEVVDQMRRAILPGKDYSAYRSLVKRLREIGPDVVHTHSSKAGIIGRNAATKVGVPAVIHTIHGLAFTASTSVMVNGFYKFLERRAAPLTTRIVTVADAMREQSLAAKIGRPEQYVTVYSGMETGPFVNPPVGREEVRRQLGLREDDVVVGTIARLFHMKGHDDLLDLARRLCNQYPRLKFLWVGDGILRTQFEEQIEKMSLKKRFRFTGLVPPSRIPELTNAMDVVAHPSRREGLARAIVQGQLAGKPVIAYDVDGNREGFLDRESGYLIPAFDRESFGSWLRVFLEDRNVRAEMGRKGREFALARFSAQKMVEDLEKVYAEALR
jgi:glycosyltransferase involved in cell wall biosynthesis